MDVRRMVRRPDHSLGGDVAVVADLTSRSSIRDAVRGMDAVVHLAARVHVMGPQQQSEAECFRVNVEGTRILGEEAAAAGVRKFIFFSSVKAVGEQSAAPWTESVTPHPRDSYGVSKLKAEEVLRELSRGTGMRAVALRLPVAYGPGMKGNMLRLFDAVRCSIPLPLLSVRNRRSVLFSGNAAAAVSAVLATYSAEGTFFVSDDSDFSTPDLVRAIGVALGRAPLLFPVPTHILSAAGRFADAITPVVTVPLSFELVQRLTGSLSVDVSKLRRVTGYRPPFTLMDGLRSTAEWYEARRASH